jgi:WD40 repeat protein
VLPDYPQHAAISGDGTRVAVATNDAVFVWNLARRSPPARVEAPHTMSVALDRRGTMLAVGGFDGRVRRWTLRLRPEAMRPVKLRSYPITGLAVRDDGEVIAAAGDNSVVRWQPGDSAPIVLHPPSARDFEGGALPSPDGTTVALLDRGALKIMSIDDGSERTLGRGYRYAELVYSNDGSTLAVPMEGRAQLWDVREGRLRQTITTSAAAGGLAVAGNLVAAASGTRFELWDADAGRPLGSRTGVPANVAMPPLFIGGGSRLLASRDKRLVLWQTEERSWRDRACALAGRDLTRSERESLPSATRPDVCRGGRAIP